MIKTKLKGYHGRILRVNLSRGDSEIVTISDDAFARYLGGRGLGAAILYREVGPDVEPLGVENKLIVLTGPMVDTRIPSSARFTVTTKSPLTGVYMYSVCSGNFGPVLKRTGCDGLIVEGKSDIPVVLAISGEGLQIIPADDLWGQNTADTERILTQRFAGKSPQIACIGPAGENLVKMACIISNGRAAGRGGAGAVMGAKNLKAVVAMGEEKCELFDQEQVTALVNEARDRVRSAPFLKEGMRKFGSAISLGITSAHGVLPTNNWQSGVFDNVDSIRPESIRTKYLVRDSACPTCVIGCAKITGVNEGPYKGAQTDGPEYETLYAFGSNCGNGNLASIISADQQCDQLGLDTISCGVTIGFAMECFQAGLISKSDTGGLDLAFGNHQVIATLIRQMALRQGAGKLFADGVREAAKNIGAGSERFAMHAKGMELGGYDPRGIRAQALVFACGPRGGCHHGGGYVIGEELVSGRWDRFASTGKGHMVRQARDNRMVMDSALFCAFMGVACGNDWTAKVISALTGMQIDAERLVLIAERASNIERMYNVREGLARKDDTLPARLMHESLPDGPSAGSVLGNNLNTLLDDFYGACGWDQETGVPTAETLKRLGLLQSAEQSVFDLCLY